MNRPALAILLATFLAPCLLSAQDQVPAAPGNSAPPKSLAGESPAPQEGVAKEQSWTLGDPASIESAAARRAALQTELQPPDGKWLIDDDGKLYFIRKHPKTLPFKRIGDERVRIVYGGEFDLAGEDETDIWLKVYRVDDYDPVPRPAAVKVPTTEELAASAATFVAPLVTVDRLHFKPFDTGMPKDGLWRNGFDLADIDGDGQIDFVHGPPRRAGDQMRVLRGDGKGNWTPYRVTVPPGLLDYGDVKVADLNGDGKMDIAAASHLRGVSAFIGDGSGHFSNWGKGLDFDAPRPGYDGSGFSSRRLELIDWNKDGRLDILALSEGPRIMILNVGKTAKVTGTDLQSQIFGPKLYLNNGDGTWTPVEEAGGPHESFGDDLAVADFNGDGRPDFLTASNGMGKMDLLYLQGKPGGDPWSRVDLPLRPRAYVNAVAAADFDGDRRMDFAVTYTSFELAVERVGVDIYLSRPHGAWQRRPVFSRDGRISLSALDAGDLDGDKHPDLVATDHEGHTSIFLGDGKGAFALEDSLEMQQPRGRCRGYQVRIAEVGLGGRPEVVASYAGEANPLYDPERCPSRGGVMVWTMDEAK
ncbi:MAG: VCBS repeat-containing protein [Thermoanaerobaculia bacterium]